MRREQIIKTAKDLSLIKDIALNPRTSPIPILCPFILGGVLGRNIEKTPKRTEAPAPINNGRLVSPKPLESAGAAGPPKNAGI